MTVVSNAVTIIVVFAILIQFLVDRVKNLVGEKVMNNHVGYQVVHCY